MTDAAATFVSTLISTAIASVVAWRVGHSSNKANQKSILDNSIVKLIEISIEYPYLENDAFCSQWPEPDGDPDKRMRYDNYCCLVFNNLEMIWRFYGGDRQKIRDMLNVDELVWRHRNWWGAEKENRKGYPLGFRDAVDQILARMSENGSAS